MARLITCPVCTNEYNSEKNRPMFDRCKKSHLVRLTKKEALKVIKALDGPSVEDKELAGVYYRLKDQFDPH